MAGFLNLIPNLAPFALWGVLLWIAAEVVWSISLWVYGLRTLFKLHRDDVAEALTLERALAPFD
ncbi:hypothetical protein Ccr2_gp324 [Caulobacter phage Ccr2]|nr:hypothetical protein Ccr2_gp002 [Caulobacter phage Ccr2]ARB14200.1 hypothetical protein Ccr2_gp324 [Caulobacter phage Ccr2]ARB14559.1 hypothetical protein Ccr29_gp002 [Caulobacter phage Ccr29]ARB14894.1 hypothetical protein Ccr29_gp338 [Caulobacter phage Ccr29]